MKNTTERTLNMEEKRKLEKLLFADIDKASNDLRILTDKRDNEIKERLEKNPPKEVAQALQEYTQAKEMQKNAEKVAEKFGYRINTKGYNDEKAYIQLGYNTTPKELKALRDGVEAKRQALTDLKRSYTIKLFAGGEVASELFKDLAKELATILK